MEDYIIWIVVIIICLIIEGITMGLTSIWFAAAAFITMLISLTGISLPAQIGIFIILSALMLIFLYPIIRDKVKKSNVKTNYESIIGKQGIVTKSIDNYQALGQVKVSGQIWTARSTNDEKIEEGSYVKVVDVKGVKLIVEKLNERRV